MVVELILETVVPAVGRLLSFVFVQVLLHTVFYITGFVISTVFTFGKRPKRFIPISDVALDAGEGWIILVGGIFWCAALIMLFSLH